MPIDNAMLEMLQVEKGVAFDEGYDSALEEVLEYIVGGIERTDEVDAIIKYIEAELGWEGDDEPIDDDLL